MTFDSYVWRGLRFLGRFKIAHYEFQRRCLTCADKMVFRGRGLIYVPKDYPGVKAKLIFSIPFTRRRA